MEKKMDRDGRRIFEITLGWNTNDYCLMFDGRNFPITETGELGKHLRERYINGKEPEFHMVVRGEFPSEEEKDYAELLKPGLVWKVQRAYQR